MPGPRPPKHGPIPQLKGKTPQEILKLLTAEDLKIIAQAMPGADSDPVKARMSFLSNAAAMTDHDKYGDPVEDLKTAEAVCDEMGFETAKVFSKARPKPQTRQRWALWLELHCRGWGYSRIARACNRDHGTIVHGIETLLKELAK